MGGRDGWGCSAISRTRHLKLHKSQLWFGAIVGAFQGVLNAGARPIILRYFIEVLASGGGSNIMTWIVLAFALVVLAEGWAKVVSSNTIAVEFPATVLSWLIPLIHRKATRIRGVKDSAEQVEKVSAGDEEDGSAEGPSSSEVALVGKDCTDVRGVKVGLVLSTMCREHHRRDCNPRLAFGHTVTRGPFRYGPHHGWQ